MSAMKYHMKAESQCSTLCCAHGSSSDYDASIYENCTHRSTSTLDLTSLQQCQVIAPDLLPGDPNKCECCSGDMLLASRKSNEILRCSLVSDCQQWMHESRIWVYIINFHLCWHFIHMSMRQKKVAWWGECKILSRFMLSGNIIFPAWNFGACAYFIGLCWFDPMKWL